jgi:hypothetical protein
MDLPKLRKAEHCLSTSTTNSKSELPRCIGDISHSRFSIRPDKARRQSRRLIDATGRIAQLARHAGGRRTLCMMAWRHRGAIVSLRTQIIFTRSSGPRSRPSDVCARYAWPFMKHVAGVPHSEGTRIGGKRNGSLRRQQSQDFGPTPTFKKALKPSGLGLTLRRRVTLLEKSFGPIELLN